MASTTAVEVSKKERKEKKDKKEKKKSKKTKTEPEPVAAEEEEVPSATEEAPQSPTSSPDASSRKRKRSAPTDDAELEVDITAPEPLSKREQRLAKKGKLDPSTKAAKPPKSSTTLDRAFADKDSSDDEDNADANAKKRDAKTPAEKSPHGVWIGNLPWSATRDSLREFLTSRAGIADASITRVHLPAPDKAAVANMRIKPQNKGFAYVDFDGAGAVEAAIEASETLMGGRPVLIKNASNFEGRPARKEGGEEGELNNFSKTAAVQAGGGKEPSKRVFVGNLTFEITKEDLVEHYSKCGEIAMVHVATFQDTGKCKGYAWVTFESLDAAAAAVAGYVMLPVEDESDEEMEEATAENVEAAEKKNKRRKKGRKWFVNRLGGRTLRVEFAEDASTRYKKRYGKDRPRDDSAAEGGEVFGEVHAERRPHVNKPRREPPKVDARTIRPGAALANAPRASGAIVEGRGKKTTFD